MSEYKMLKTPLVGDVKRLFQTSQRELAVVSPFINGYGLDVLHEAIQGGTKTRRLTILTCVSVQNIRNSSLDISALSAFCDEFKTCRVRNLPGLHAKVYIADGLQAIVTSANLTRGGLVGNYEYGFLISDTRAIENIRADMSDYSNLGSELTIGDLRGLAECAQELQSAAKDAEKAIRASDAWRSLSQKVETVQDNLLRNRVRGKTVNSIFADTIRYLLRLGPMSTENLEARIQATHPDMCDDTINRVIDGVAFGKKWKHMVRNTQQFLKRKGEIELDNGTWRLIN